MVGLSVACLAPLGHRHYALLLKALDKKETIALGWNITLTTVDFAIIFATLLGPVLAVQAQKLLERQRDIKGWRLAIFRTLMATRAAMLSPTRNERQV